MRCPEAFAATPQTGLNNRRGLVSVAVSVATAATFSSTGVGDAIEPLADAGEGLAGDAERLLLDRIDDAEQLARGNAVPHGVEGIGGAAGARQVADRKPARGPRGRIE